MKRIVLFCLGAVLALVPALSAVETRNWTTSEQNDFEKGTLKKLSLRSDGRLTLAPLVKELLDASAAYLWTLAQDSQGNLYTSGGGTGSSRLKLFQIAPGGQSKTYADLEGLEIHAIAVNRQDQVFAATQPDAKVYRIENGKPVLFYDPKAKYVWAMAFDSKGNLFLATGDNGEVHRITPDGRGAVFFRTEETHARSLAIDPQDNLIVGTEPGGLIVRVTPAGQGFVLYQTAKREVTAVAVAPDGRIFAAAVGTKPAAGSSGAPASIPISTPAATPGAPASSTAAAPRAGAATALVVTLPSVPGGSDIYSIDREGYAKRIWSQPQDIVYAIAFDASGAPLVATGNRGIVYRLDGGPLSTQLVNLIPTQVTALLTGRNGQVYAATGNIGKVFQLGPGREAQGTYESDAFDAGQFAYWGRLTFAAEPGNGIVAFAAHSGNLERVQKDWSVWTNITAESDGGRMVVPPARFVQYRATLTAPSTAAQSPAVTSIDVAYLPKNVPPSVEAVEITPANYRFPAPTTSLITPTRTLSLPTIGQSKRSSVSAVTVDSGATLQYAKGFAGVRWSASDENGDELRYRVEIRGRGETVWKLLKDEVRERFLSFDTTAFPDGRYLVRVTATDAPGNPPGQALTATYQSDPFLLDNTPPRVLSLASTVPNGKLRVTWQAKDALSPVTKAEYSVNGGEWCVVEPTTKVSDSLDQQYMLPLDRPAIGEITIAVRVTDEFDNQTVEKLVIR